LRDLSPRGVLKPPPSPLFVVWDYLDILLITQYQINGGWKLDNQKKSVGVPHFVKSSDIYFTGEMGLAFEIFL